VNIHVGTVRCQGTSTFLLCGKHSFTNIKKPRTHKVCGIVENANDKIVVDTRIITDNTNRGNEVQEFDV
jgi:hypothetical protein